VLVVSPYLVLTPGLIEVADELTANGVEIRVLTNSLASNDVVVAHAAYARFRRKLLDAGVELFEFRDDSTINPPNGDGYSSLHSKYIVFDDDMVFIGSMNLDPRSLYINTELGIVLRSRALAQQFTADFERLTSPDNAWRVYDTPEGLRWAASRGVLEQQPARNDWQRTRAGLYSLLPLAGQL
jgi:putative cardiolipin synthase